MAPADAPRGACAAQQPASPETLLAWRGRQTEIARCVVTRDAGDWARVRPDGRFARDLFVAGADVSFSVADAAAAVATLTVVRLRRCDGAAQLVYSRSRAERIVTPYAPSYLAFREAPVVAAMLRELPGVVRARIDCILLDGNGILHPRRAGLASHVGVENDIAAIGVSKTLYCLDGLEEPAVRAQATAADSAGCDVVGASGTVWARALITGNAKNKPIYVSTGHKVSLPTAAKLVAALCRYRVPEPIRAADLNSRKALRGEDPADMYESQAFAD